MHHQYKVISNKPSPRKVEYITRIYVEGWVDSLPAFEEEVYDDFAEICRHNGDDPSACHLVGEAKNVWVREKRRHGWIAKVRNFKFHPKAVKATMMRVHRNSTPCSKPYRPPET